MSQDVENSKKLMYADGSLIVSQKSLISVSEGPAHGASCYTLKILEVSVQNF